MAIQLSDHERGSLIDSVRRLLEDGWPVEGAPERAEDAAALRTISASLCELGLFELGADDGPGLADAAAVMEELGRAACPANLPGGFVANRLIDAAGGAVADALRAAKEAGRFPAVALGAYDGDRMAGRAVAAGDRVSGAVDFVEGASAADHLILLAGEVPAVAVVGLNARGVAATANPGLAVPALSGIALDGVAAAVAPCGEELLVEAAQIVRLLTAARALGAAQRAFDLTVEHAKQRRQFGRAIGTFQAIQHKLADCFSRLEGVRLGIASAAGAYDRGDAHWGVFADAVIAFAGPALRQLALDVHHTLGAIGYAEEHEAPRHFRRIHADLVRFGGAARARAGLAGYLLASGAAKLPSHDRDATVIAFRGAIRDWLAEHWPEAARETNARGPLRNRRWIPDFSRRMGAAGWLGLDWPKAHGGQARTAGEQLAFIEELEFAEAPTDSYMTAETIVGPAIIAFGTDEQKADFLPALLRGERTFALHYSEPEAGSDLASLRTAARRDGAEWVISGQKLWSTYGDQAEYAFLAARTDPDAKPKHAGISVFLVPLDTPGISIRPSMAMYGRTFSATFYDEVRLPGSALLGPENGGWKVITSALAAERVMIGNTVAHLQHMFGKLARHVAATAALRDDPLVRDRIGTLAAELEIARQFTLRNSDLVQAGRSPVYEAAMSKIFVGELQERIGEAALDILGSGGLLGEEAPSAPLGEMEQELRHSLMGVLGGGTGEIQRNIIALRGLDLPRPA